MATPYPSKGPSFWRLRLLGLVALVLLLSFFLIKKAEPWIFQVRVRTVAATYGVEEQPMRAEGVVVRHEDVVRSPMAGRVTLLVGEGRRVRAGDVIVEVNPILEEIPLRIAELEEELTKAASDHERRLADLQRQHARATDMLAQAERALQQALNAGDREAVERALARRDQIALDVDQVEAEKAAADEAHRRRVDELLAERTALRAPPTTAIVTAPGSGVVSFVVDGFEERQPGQVLEPLDRLEGHQSRLADGMRVAVGDPLFRLVDTAKPVEVMVVTKESLVPVVGTQVELTFDHEPQQRLRGRLTEAVQDGREWWGRVVLEAADPSLMHQRRVRLTLLLNRAEGIVVPASAVVTLADERQGVYVMLGDRPVFREAKVLGGSARRLVIDAPRGVPVGAPVVINPHVVSARLGQR